MTTTRTKIPFDQVKKFNTQGKPDLSATLGAIVKATWNQTAIIKILGNLTVQQTVRGQKNRILIESDNRADRIRLYWLRPWFGYDIENSSFADDWKGIDVSFDQFDRQFILPYLDELRAHLGGQQPAEALMMEGFHRFTQWYISGTAISFDAKAVPAMDEKSGKVIVRLLDGTKVVGVHQLSKKRRYACGTLIHETNQLETLEKAKQCELLLRLDKDKLIKTLLAEVEMDMAHETEEKSQFSFISSKKFTSEKKQNLYLIHALLLAFYNYRTLPSGISLLEPLRKIIIDYIIHTLLPRLTVADLLQIPKTTGAYSYLHCLLQTCNSKMIKAVFDKAHKEGVDLSNPKINPPVIVSVANYNVAHSLIERRQFFSQLFDEGLRLTPEFAEKIVSYHSRNELEDCYKVRNKPQKPVRLPVWSVTSWEETKPVISFERAARFCTDNRTLNFCATLAELIKQTCNARARESNQPGIVGELSVLGYRNQVTIRSDHEEDDLQQLSFWLGAVEKRERGNHQIVASLEFVDRHFIFPYLADFRRHLGGQHPLATDFYSWWVFPDTFDLQKQMEDFVRNHGVEQWHADRTVEKIRWQEGFNSEQDYITDFIFDLFKWFDELPQYFTALHSVSIGVRKHIANVVMNELLPAWERVGSYSWVLARALDFFDRRLFNSVLAKLRAENIELSNYFFPHPLNWLSEHLSSCRVIKFLAPIDRQWYVRRMLDEGVVITSEVEQAMKDGKLSQADIALIHGEIFLRYKKIFADLQGFLSQDPSRQVMRFLVGDEYVEKTLKEQPAPNGRLGRALFAKPNENIKQSEFTSDCLKKRRALFAKPNMKLPPLVGFREERSTQPTKNFKSAFFVPSPAPGNFAEEKSRVRERVRVRVNQESAPLLKRTRSYP